MKKIIREQANTATTPKPTDPNPFIGKTVNFYKDAQNKEFRFRKQIKSFDVGTQNNPSFKTEDYELHFDCATQVLYASYKGVSSRVYNLSFENTLKKTFCTKNPKGVNVPKSDFVSTDKSTSSNMAEGKRVIRLTESDLVRLVKKVINEQNTQDDYKEIADYLHSSMEGLSSGKDAENIESIIINRIKNKNDWEGVKKAFGVRDGENLEQWLSGEMRIDLKQIMNWIGEKETKFRKEDSMYNPGSKIPLITNRQFIMGRAYNYSSTMGDKQELEADIENATVVKRDKDAIVVKAKFVKYYSVGERRTGEYPKPIMAYDVCIRIPFDEIIEWRDDTLQVRWLSDFVGSHIVQC
jgi:hypothetical protein